MNTMSTGGNGVRKTVVASRFLVRFGVLVVLSFVLLKSRSPDQSGVVTPEGSWTAKLSPCAATTINDKHVPHAFDHGDGAVDDLEFPENGLCSFLANQQQQNNPINANNGTTSLLLSQGASRWWISHVDNVLAASHFAALDPDFVHQPWMGKLLATLTPAMLQRGINSRPLPTSVQAVAELVYQRLASSLNTTRSIRIAVVGGSVTQGRGCEAVSMPGYVPHKDARCAWPKRLENFINQLFGMELVQVHNLAIGGTSLAMATPLVKYWLYPPVLLPEGPDIIISAYATNEQFTYPNRVDTTNSTMFADLKRDVVQEFIRAVNDARPCADRPPLMIFLDDYLGNQQDRILGETTYQKVVTELADWYGNVLHVSYANVVRRLVYAETDRALFTPKWPRDESGQTSVEVHFGMVGHVTISWVLGFALLDSLVSYCENEAFLHAMSGRPTMLDESVMHLVQNVPPPPLTKETTLTTITQQWNQAAEKRRINQDQNCGDPDFSKPPCAFAFLAGPSGTVRRPKQLLGYIAPFKQHIRGWTALEDFNSGGFARKLGFVATEANATFTMKLTNLAKEVRVLNLQTLKSYGEKWANSTARFVLTVSNPGQEQVTNSFEILGFHNSPTSVTYPFEFDLGETKALKNATVTLRIDLIGGTTFKIIAMMLCNR